MIFHPKAIEDPPPLPCQCVRLLDVMERSYLALGDSYTIGEGVSEKERWPVQLARLLGEEGVLVSPPAVVAVTGWTTDELEDGIGAQHLRENYDLVTLLIGVNDQYRGRGVEEFEKGFTKLMDIAAGFTKGVTSSKVVVVSIPDWGVTPFGQSSKRSASTAVEIDAYNAAAAEISQALGAHWVDITPLSRTQGAQVVGDGLHPSGSAYAQWVDLIAPTARVILSRE